MTKRLSGIPEMLFWWSPSLCILMLFSCSIHSKCKCQLKQIFLQNWSLTVLINQIRSQISSVPGKETKESYQPNYSRAYLEEDEEGVETIITKSPSVTPKRLGVSAFPISFPLYNSCCCWSGT